MFASVSHELRTPINIINNCITCLKLKADHSQLKWLDIASTSASFLLSLVNDTLDFTQMKMGKFSLNFHQVDISQLVEEISNMIRIQLQLRPQVRFELDDSKVFKNVGQESHCDGIFVTDAQRLKQIMINLLRNSVKFTIEGVIRLTAEMFY